MSFSDDIEIDQDTTTQTFLVDSTAQTEDGPGEPSAPRTCVTLEFGDQAFAIDVGIVREILDYRQITPLPNAPADLLGMIDLRGESIAVIDPTARLGLRSASLNPQRIIVLEPDADTRDAVGVIAERVLSVIECPTDMIEPVPETMTGWTCDGVLGVLRVSGRQTILLDLAQIIRKDQHRAFDFA